MNSVSDVTVVIPAFNAGSTLPRAIDSVLRQSLAPAEILVVDDGSTDDTVDVLKQYIDSVSIRYVRQSNAGAASARNLGCSLASGRYIAFLDADDIWLQAKLEIQVAAMQRNQSARFSWVGALFLDETDGTVPLSDIEARILQGVKPRGQIESLVGFSEVVLKPYLGTPCVMIETALVRELGGFDQNLKSAEDVDLWIRAASKAKGLFIDKKLVVVLRQRMSLSQIQSDQTFVNHLAVLEKCRAEQIEHSLVHSQCIDRAKADVYEHWGSHLLARGRYLEAMPALKEALRRHISPRSIYLIVKAVICSVLSKSRI
jgi:glycosyltransferase involved in cell wall biosynthesis